MLDCLKSVSAIDYDNFEIIVIDNGSTDQSIKSIHDNFPKIQADNNVVILPTIIFFDDGEEVERLQGDMSFTLKTTTDELDEVVEEILGNKF